MPDKFKKINEEYIALIDEITASSIREEQRIQAFLERRPQFLPGLNGVHVHANHGVYCDLIFPKFPLNGTFNRVPDFMFVTKSSVEAQITFIEIEEPSKSFFTTSNDFTSEFNHAFQQLEDWKTWLENGNNGANLRTELTRAISHHMMNSIAIVFKFVLVYGRRSEYQDNEIRRNRISQRSRGAYQIMSFDRLEYADYNSNLICVKRNDAGYYATEVSEFYDYNYVTRSVHKNILNKQASVSSNSFMSNERKMELINKINQLDAMSDEDTIKNQLPNFGK